MRAFSPVEFKSTKSALRFLVCLFDVLPAVRNYHTYCGVGSPAPAFFKYLYSNTVQVHMYIRVYMYMRMGGTHYVMFIIGEDSSLAMF